MNEKLSDTLTALSRAADGLSAVIKLISHELEDPRQVDDSETLTLAINALNSAQGAATALAEDCEQTIRPLEDSELDFPAARALVTLREAQTSAFHLEAVLELAKLNLQTGKDAAAMESVILALDGAAYWAGEVSNILLLPMVNSLTTKRYEVLARKLGLTPTGAEDLA